MLPDAPAHEKADITEYCLAQQADGELLDRMNQIVRYKDFAVKFGKVTREEAENQQQAYTLLDPKIARVPKVHYYFTVVDTDYLVMDYVFGEKKQKIGDDETIEAIGKIVTHLHGFAGDLPGPVTGGKCRGTLWPDDDSILIGSLGDLEQLVKSRCVRSQFTFRTSALAFIHGDLRLSNIMFSPDGIWLLDWEFAGYFPRSAEIATLRQDYAESIDDLNFRHRLADAITQGTPLTAIESHQVDAFLEFAFNNIRFAWTSVTTGTRKKKQRKPRHSREPSQSDDLLPPSANDGPDARIFETPPLQLQFDVPW